MALVNGMGSAGTVVIITPGDTWAQPDPSRVSTASGGVYLWRSGGPMLRRGTKKLQGGPMRASLIIAAHNEGESLMHTLQTCDDSAVDFEYETIVVDDASTDGSVDRALSSFPHIRATRTSTRTGASPAKALGASLASGDVLIFLDGHTNPEPGALNRLAEDVEALDGQAVITPTLSQLDVGTWRNTPDQRGHGYALDLRSMSASWQPLADMNVFQAAGRRFYESPTLVGCALAVSRSLYERLRGFDPHMRVYGVEDLDFGLKAWLMGFRVLHDPVPVVGHRFRTVFDNYTVPVEQVLANQMRMARKNFTESVWSQWLDEARTRNMGRLPDRPEGLWARAWELFKRDYGSVEQEKAYLQARRTRDEIWFAEYFGLDWPALLAADRPAGDLGFAPFGSPSTAPSAAPSGGPPSCVLNGISPASAVVPVNATVTFTAQGTGLSGVTWNAPGATPASGSGPSFTAKWAAGGNRVVSASCGGVTRQSAVTVTAVTGVLTPADNFAGRSRVRFGVGEVISLSFTSAPAVTAAQLGGLRWFITAGGGTLSGTSGTGGTGTYTAPGAGGTAQLALKIVSGRLAGTVVATRQITIVAPSDALMIRATGTNLEHTNNTWSCGFLGNIFLRPKDVSFQKVEFLEGTVNAVATGYLSNFNGLPHHGNPSWLPFGAGNAANGSQLTGRDHVFTGVKGPPPPPYGNGDFLWAIPWFFRVIGTAGAGTQFTTANQHHTADPTGQATAAKKGAGPFSRVPGDPTSTP